MPTIFREKGYRFFFFSGDKDEPAHVHVEYGEKYGKFWLYPISLASIQGLKPHDISEIYKIIKKNQTLFLEKWDEYFNL